jgi:hypothetical protein
MPDLSAALRIRFFKQTPAVLSLLASTNITFVLDENNTVAPSATPTLQITACLLRISAGDTEMALTNYTT